MTIGRLLLILLASFSLSADPISDVRNALGRFPGRDMVRGTFEVQRTVKNEGKFGNDNFSGKVGVEIEANANGYQLMVGRPLLEQIEREREARDRNPKLSTPIAQTLGEINAAGAADVLDFAPTLLRLLDGAKIVSDAAGTWAGKPARVVILRAADRLDDDDASKVKVAENRVTLWLDSENVPQAVEHMWAAKFSFLFLKGETRQKKSWHLARAADRLVRARYEYTETSSGMGQKGSETLVATVRMH
ncbi:MAG TPA: hypothetical protein VND45_09170 [Thermoanaerobaculia bacterium]|jgi:hypothetical protein|nr:hypothetical protein [Thermoanaerobaculia bacterium]